jgi:hypothetical protein|tara:strand:+ start:153 stop:842 length:690 start_codon:yes stop_codon:yes gene_type:complete
MEYIYIAKSKSFPGMVKIGRTDRPVEQRMDELSEGDYGTSGFSGDSEWEAVSIIKVENNETAEAIIHSHFDNLRVEDGRELFYCDNPEEITEEAVSLVEGTLLTADIVDSLNLFTPLSIAASATGILIVAQTFFPKNTNTVKAEKFMTNWRKRLENKSMDAKTTPSKIFYGTLKKSFYFSELMATILLLPLAEKRNKMQKEEIKRKYDVDLDEKPKKSLWKEVKPTWKE